MIGREIEKVTDRIKSRNKHIEVQKLSQFTGRHFIETDSLSVGKEDRKEREKERDRERDREKERETETKRQRGRER